ncbi:MAG TPA: ABC transporter permease [Burkholderiales bacterium]|nr:ABC transporter permease [Burkholderiales bacterium]
MSPASAGASPRWGWLLLSFTRRELLNRYSGSFSGLAWTLLHPLAQLAIYAFVFNRVFRIGVPADFPGVRYVTFMAVALWPWIMFSEGLQRAMGSIGANAGLIRKVAFPHRLLVFAAILGTVIVHSVGFLAVLLVLRLMGEPIALSRIPLAFILLVPYLLLAAGIGAFLAALQTLLRDVEHVMQVVLQMLFYAAPILYPVTLVPESLRPWVELNPLGWFSERLRAVLLHGGGFVPGDAAMALLCAAIFLAGLWFFERLSPHFEDFL